MLGGTGEPTKTGAGTLVITADNSGYTATTQVAGGTLAVNGVLGGAVGVAAAGRLEGNGRVAGVTNAGIVAPGSGGIGELTMAGDYTGHGGTQENGAVLGGDASSTDRMVVNGSAAGEKQIAVPNRDIGRTSCGERG